MTNAVQLPGPTTLAVRPALPEILRLVAHRLEQQLAVLVDIIVSRDDLRQLVLADGRLRFATGGAPLLRMDRIEPQTLVAKSANHCCLRAAGVTVDEDLATGFVDQG